MPKNKKRKASDIIKDLEDMYARHGPDCPGVHCYIAEDGRHLRLDRRHIAMWAHMVVSLLSSNAEINLDYVC